MSSNSGGGLEQSFAAALRAAESSPDSDDAWDHLEELADQLQRPEEVAELYRKMLDASSVPADYRDALRERAVQFHEEWFDDNPEVVDDLLASILQRDPAAEWAFERLTVRLTSSERWDKLLAAYDQVLRATEEPSRRRQLLDDAASVAKDFALEPDRAAGYMQQRLDLEPDNTQLLASLERLLERQSRWDELIGLWRRRLSALTPVQAQETRVRIAQTCLEQLNDPRRALDELEQLLSEAPGHEAACEQLERLLSLEEAPTEIRRAALGLLRKNYDSADRGTDVVRVLRAALDFVDDEERGTLLREIGSRLAILGNDEEAMEHYASLLRVDPSDTDARKQLRQLAERSGQHERHAKALEDAATGSEAGGRVRLLLEAAHLRRDRLDDGEGASALYRQVIEGDDAEPADALAAAHSLNELLAQADRNEERLAVLRRIGELEQVTAVRRAILGDVARLAAELGETDQALAAWGSRLEGDANDLEALEATLELLTGAERWEEVLGALERRAAAPILPQQRRADLVRMAAIQGNHLERTADAIDTWLRVREEFGEDVEVLGALDELMSRAERHDELARLLDGAAGGQRAAAGRLLTRLADLCRGPLEQPARAVELYRQALAVDASNAEARSGATALLEVEEVAGHAAEALVAAYQAAGEYERVLELLDQRLGAAAEPRQQVAVLREAAELHEHRAGQPGEALEAIARALPCDPADRSLEDELLRLGEQAGAWERVTMALRQAAEAAADTPRRAAQLQDRAGSILESRLEDAAAAMEAYREAARLDPERVSAVEALTRAAARAGEWGVAAGAMVGATIARDRLNPELLATVESAAESADGFAALAAALEETLSQRGGDLRPSFARQLDLRLVSWYSDRVGDLDAGEAAARRAVKHDTSDVDALRGLATMQRRSPGLDLIQTLLLIDGADENSLDALREAAEVALQHADDAKVRSLLDRLYRRAAVAWTRGEELAGEHQPRETALWALDALVERRVAAGDHATAAALLLDASSLPIEGDKALEMRRRAAEMTAASGQRWRAVELYHAVLEETPNDVEVLGRAAELCEQEGRVAELIDLRSKLLALTEDADARLALRLDLARLAGALEARGGRVTSLVANLEDAPGHRPTIEALIEVLEERGRFQELADLLTEQAKVVEESDAAWAGEMWTRVALIEEERLARPAHAIVALERVVSLAPSSKALDGLARLLVADGHAAKAATWLERRLEGATPKERVAVLLRLARARIDAGQPKKAIAALESAFEDAPRNASVRKLLIRLHREREDWAALADTLARATEHVGDDDTILAYAREAAELFHGKLSAPERAVPVLEKATALVPEDRELRKMLAEGLRVSGRLDEARAMLTELVGAYGRRRSPKRAAVHLELARVAHAQGEMAEAIDQLENASKMDAGNVAILNDLARMARESGQLDRAERAYRTLLINVRRAGADAPADQIGPAGVLTELSSIAREKGDDAQAEELIESALEALAGNDREAPGLQKTLEEREDWELLRRVLETRLASESGAHRRAQIHSGLARIYEGPIEDLERALECRLAAIDADAGSPEYHDAAMAIAARLEQADRYVAKIEALLESARRDSDAHVRVELLLRLGEVRLDAGDLDGAEALFEQAEGTGVRQVDAWRAMAKLAGARGDSEMQMKLLERLAELGEDQAGTRADALYRMAEVRLASAETVDEGVDTLRRALDDTPRWERASMILRRAAGLHEGHEDLLELYEQVARQMDDGTLLLDYLQRRLDSESATPDHAREATALAREAEDEEKGEQFMLRAVQLAEGQLDGMAKVEWALLGLARRRKSLGDLAGAVKWIGEATEACELEAVLEVAREVAEASAGPDGDLTLAARVYEQILARDATVRAAWEPLARLYRELGDADHLERLVEETLDGLDEPADRNALRLELARSFAHSEDRIERAIEVLRDAVLEVPTDQEAQDLLADCLERTGNEAELIELMRNRMMAAQGEGDADGVRAAALVLGRRLEPQDAYEALNVYRQALEVCADDPELLRMVIDRLDPEDDAGERIELLERLLGVCPPEEAGELTMMLVGVHEANEDGEGVMRALKIGYGRAPEDLTLRDRLMKSYEEQGDYAGLAASLVETADQVADPASRAAFLREASRVQAGQLGDASAAAQLLQRAVDLKPDDVDLRLELAGTLQMAGQPTAALEVVDAALEHVPEDEPGRARLLQTRADMRGAAGDASGAVQDLEAAYVLAPEVVAEQLEDALEGQRAQAAASGDAEGERPATLRLVELRLRRGARDEARALLEEWIDRSRKDHEALVMLRDVDLGDQRWEGVLKVCGRLVAITEGEEQRDAALQLSQAAFEVGEAKKAKMALEHALRHQPGEPALRAELRRVYAAIGAEHELAKMLLEDAAEAEADEKVGLLREAADTLLRVGDTDAALPALDELMQLQPGDAHTVALLADAYVQQDRLEEADQTLDAAIAECRGRRSPELALYQHRKARIAAARGDRRGYLEGLQQAHLTDKTNGHITVELANLAEEMEEWDLAIKVLRSIAVNDQQQLMSRTEALLRQAKIALRRDDRQRALLWGRRALQEDSESEEVKAFLASLGEG